MQCSPSYVFSQICMIDIQNEGILLNNNYSTKNECPT